MIKKALEYLAGLGEANVHYENNQAYSDRQLHLLNEATAEPFELNTLSGLVDYLKSHVDGDSPVIVHVVSPTRVTVTSSLNNNAKRNYFIKAEAMVPNIRFNNFYEAEDFNILLQSCFVPNDDKDIVLKLVGNIKDENVNTFGDSGISQTVVAKIGVASVDNVEVPNPVELIPYRTFVEVVQPESDFVFRMKNGPLCALFEADGGAWKIHAIENIKDYLEKSLKEEISVNRVHIIA